MPHDYMESDKFLELGLGPQLLDLADNRRENDVGDHDEIRGLEEEQEISACRHGHPQDRALTGRVKHAGKILDQIFGRIYLGHDLRKLLAQIDSQFLSLASILTNIFSVMISSIICEVSAEHCIRHLVGIRVAGVSSHARAGFHTSRRHRLDG